MIMFFRVWTVFIVRFTILYEKIDENDYSDKGDKTDKYPQAAPACIMHSPEKKQQSPETIPPDYKTH